MHSLWTQNTKQAGASAADIEAWNLRFGRNLPESLAVLLQEHNGGELNGNCTPKQLLCLAEIKPVDTEFLTKVWQSQETMEEWRDELEESELPGDTVFFPVARAGNMFFWFAWLNVEKDKEEPFVFSRHWDDMEFSNEGEISQWIDQWLAPIPLEGPVVFDLDEADDLELIFEETSSQNDGDIIIDQRLGKRDGKLWLYTHEQWPSEEQETYTKTMIPDGFDATLERALGGWQLALEIENPEDGYSAETSREEDVSGWLYEVEEEGCSCHVEIISNNRDSLVVLRQKLIGKELSQEQEKLEKSRMKSSRAPMQKIP